MGAPTLTAEEQEAWRDLLRGHITDDAIAEALPALTTTRTRKAMMDNLTDEQYETAILAVTNLDPILARSILSVWKRAREAGGVTTGKEQSVIMTRVTAAAAASRARRDNARQAEVALGEALDGAFEDMDDLEGDSRTLYVALASGHGSLRLERLLREGHDGVHDTEGGTQINKQGLVEEKEPQWKKYCGSRKDWLAFIKRIKKVLKKARRWGACSRLDEFCWYLEDMDWWVCKAYIPRYMEDHFGKLDMAEDDKIMRECERAWDRAGRPLLEPDRLETELARDGAVGGKSETVMLIEAMMLQNANQNALLIAAMQNGGGGSGGGGGGGGGGGMKCFNCGQTGHLSRDCPQLTEAERKAKNDEAAAKRALHGKK